MVMANASDNNDVAQGQAQAAIVSQGDPPPEDFAIQSCHHKLTWIEIHLVDMEGNPVAGEKYRITDVDGKKHEGSLDQNGRARVNGIRSGSCIVTFLNRDTDAWERL
jgi:hypothetical protein